MILKSCNLATCVIGIVFASVTCRLHDREKLYARDVSHAPGWVCYFSLADGWRRVQWPDLPPTLGTRYFCISFAKAQVSSTDECIKYR